MHGSGQAHHRSQALCIARNEPMTHSHPSRSENFWREELPLALMSLRWCVIQFPNCRSCHSSAGKQLSHQSRAMSTTPAYHSYISKTFLSTRGARFFSLNNATTKYQRLLSLCPDACMGDLIPELNHSFKGTDTRLSLAFQDSSPRTTQLALQRSSLHQVPLQHELVFS